MSQWMRFKQLFSSVRQWRPSRIDPRITLVLGMALVGGVAFGIGRWIGLGSIQAQQPGRLPFAPGAGTTPGYDKEYDSRVVAYIYGNIPITRVDLAEYLIARFGSQRLEFLVNRKIVERACQSVGVEVSDGEVEEQFRRDLLALGPHMTPKMFEEQVLRRYNKTIFEWKEDVIRPKISLSKLVATEVTVTDADIRKQFDIYHGPKVKVRMIVYKDSHDARQAWQRMKNSSNLREAFMTEAGQQMIGELASVKGEVPPIHQHFGDKRIEDEAFRLKPGEISQAFEMTDQKAIILLCEGHIPADVTKRFEQERVVLMPQVRELMISQKVQEKVAQLRKDAAPRFLLTRQPSIDQLQRDVSEELQEPKFKSR